MSKPNDVPNGRREFLKGGAIIVIGGFINRGLRAEALDKTASKFLDEATVHNMLVVGQENIFLSHLPMFSTPTFDSPHRYQVILDADFTKDGSEARTVYANDRKQNPKTKIYTLNPDKFVLPNLISSNSGEIVRSFKANVFRGHLERPENKLLLSAVDVSIRKVIHCREFDSKAKPLSQLEYILFGKGKDLFLAHLITRPPDFDQVVSVEIGDSSFTDEELGNGMHVTFES